MNPCQLNALTNSQPETDFPSPLPLRRVVNPASLRGEGKGEGVAVGPEPCWQEGAGSVHLGP